METILPPPLKFGDTIGFFSPSFPITANMPERTARGIAYLKEKGFNIKAGQLTGISDQYRSGSIQQRADELNALIRDPSVRCIMSTIGGFNSNALLPYIDYDALLKDPKIIIGYSDVTALLLGIYAKTGLVTFYGPALLASFGEYPPLVDETFSSFKQLVVDSIGDAHAYMMPERWTDEMVDWQQQSGPKNTFPNAWYFHGEGVFTGRLIGGNPNTMAGIWGSEFMPEVQRGDILLIEDSLMGIDAVERSFAHLKVCGVFDKLSAILLGKHELFDHKGTGRQPLEVLREVLNGQQVPVVSDFDSCHTHPMLTLPLGAKVTVDFEQKSISLVDGWQ
ncbi:LD-carboxypeptidase [Veronia nyctiphanis]|uniref:LD-carboxypeptidase n=1 Tax=Veronia nyctiphanis TaxID=1278244 RepID=A0A4Q0YM14_9GAMM|nr:S66 peptidase family protein [Veronia nyctiphanis]RXJ71746.1 LD-carboxypeptidase [Veronia nyctiphanis]